MKLIRWDRKRLASCCHSDKWARNQKNGKICISVNRRVNNFPKKDMVRETIVIYP